MSVYIGIDVHRKRSQVAVIGQGGEVLANRNEHIYAKIGVSSRAAATLYATRHGLMGAFEPLVDDEALRPGSEPSGQPGHQRPKR